MNAGDVRDLIAARDHTGVTIGEAFMVQVHPQWKRTMELVRCGAIGSIRYAMGTFSYFNAKPENIRNIAGFGGGALMDIGCYPIKVSRVVFGEEPLRVSAIMRRDPAFGTDIVASALLEFPSGPCLFSCGTQVVPNQNMQFHGTTGRIELKIPFNAIPDEIARILIDDGSDLLGGGIRVEEFAPCDQYTLQGDAFSRAVLDRTPPPVPLEDSLRTMIVIDAVVRAAASGRWEQPEPLQ
jgi:predicted dehydrogenase